MRRARPQRRRQRRRHPFPSSTIYNLAHKSISQARHERMETARKLKEAKDAKDGKVKSDKPKPVEKSLVVLDVKPWEADTGPYPCAVCVDDAVCYSTVFDRRPGGGVAQDPRVRAGGSHLGRDLQARASGIWHQEARDDRHDRGQSCAAGRRHGEHRGHAPGSNHYPNPT